MKPENDYIKHGKLKIFPRPRVKLIASPNLHWATIAYFLKTEMECEGGLEDWERRDTHEHSRKG